MRHSNITLLKRPLRRRIDTGDGQIVVTLTPAGELRVRRKWARAEDERSINIAQEVLDAQRMLDFKA